MPIAEQWNWVIFAYGVTYFTVVVYGASVAMRITRVRKKLDSES